MASLEALCQKFWAWRMKESPEFATSIGFHEYDDRLDDLSQEAIDKRKVFCEDFLKELDKLSGLTKQEKLTHDLLRGEVAGFLEGLPFCSYLFPINNMEGPQIDFERIFLWMKFLSVSDYEKALQRLKAFPSQADQIMELMRRGIKEKRIAPAVSLSGVEKQFQAITSQSPKQLEFFKPFKTFPEAVPVSERERIAGQALSILRDEVLPAYTRLQDFLAKEYIPACRQTVACADLPNGQAYYSQCLKFHTSTDLSAQQVHDTGLEEVSRIRGEIDRIINDVNFSGNFKEFIEHLRTSPEFYFKSEKELLQAYQDTCKQIRAKLPLLVRDIPNVECKVVETPSSSAPSAPAAYYFAASEDGSRPGTFYINTFNFETRPKYDRVALCLHECEPGHHLQSAYAMQQTNLPAFRRHMEDRVYYQAPGRFAMNTAYMEGWGLYSESLGEDLGLYGDPYTRFGRLSMEILRACRLVVDTGMHALGWSRQKALDYMSANCAISFHEVQTEIDRYITWPGQACAYKIGELKIKEYRKLAAVKLGEKFDLRDFHEVVLSLGATSLYFLEEAVKDYISQQSC